MAGLRTRPKRVREVAPAEKLGLASDPVTPEEAAECLEDHRRGPVLLAERSDGVVAGVVVHDPGTVTILGTTGPGEMVSVEIGVLGSSGEAEDAVQEARLRLGRSDTSGIENLDRWPTPLVGRVCPDVPRSRQSRP